MAFTPDGSLLATADGGPHTVSVFSSTSSGALTPVVGSPFAAAPGGPISVAFSPDGALSTLITHGILADGTTTTTTRQRVRLALPVSG